MTEMLLIWLGAPAVFLLVCYGLGLSIPLITRKPMNSAIVTVTGFLLIVIIGSLTTASARTAPYTAAVIAGLSLVGFAVTGMWFRSYFRIEYNATLAGFIAYVLYSLPVAAYGKPGWAGWVQLDDNSTWYAITDRLMTIGHSVPPVIATTYDRVIQIYMGGHAFNDVGVNNGAVNYPLGAYVPYGVMSKISHVDLAWAFQPFLSVCAGLAAMLIALILRGRVRSKFSLIAMSVFSVMASLIFSYAMWGGIKEIVVLAPLLFFAFTLFAALEVGMSRALLTYPAISIAALLFIGGKASAGLVAPILVIAFLAKITRLNRKMILGILSAIGVLVIGAAFYLGTGKSLGNIFVPEVRDNGNLYGPLNLLHIMGIWPSKDFRLPPYIAPLTYLVIFTAIGFAVFGIYIHIRRRSWVLPSLIASCAAVVAYSNIWGGIWLTGKALAVASPIFLLASVIGAYEIWSKANRRRRNRSKLERIPWIQTSLVALVVIGVLLSDSLTYRNTWLSPYPQLKELQTIGKLFAGHGPLLMTEYSPYGARYFLRNTAAESASELRVHPIALRDGSQLPKGAAADIDLFDNASLDYFNLLVLRKSANASRPPLNFDLVWSGDTYEVWKKNDTKLTIDKTLILGTNFTPATPPSCADVDAFVAQRTKGDHVYTVERAKDYVIDFSVGDLPLKWLPIAAPNGGVERVGSGGIARDFIVDTNQDYEMWLAGAYPGHLTVQVDFEDVFSGSSMFEGNPSLTNPLGKIYLSAGRHTLTLTYDTPWLTPGSDVNYKFGPIYLSTQTAGGAKVEKVANADIPKLCTRNLDWIALAK